MCLQNDSTKSNEKLQNDASLYTPPALVQVTYVDKKHLFMFYFYETKVYE